MRRTPLRRISKKGRARMERMRRLRRRLYDLKQGKCDCHGKPQPWPGHNIWDPSHRKPRSLGGSDDLVNLDLLCRATHEATHERRAGTERWRTKSWQPEGQSEAEAEA